MNKINLSPEKANLLRENCKERIEVADALTRLHNNDDFKLVFLKNYIDEEPSRIVNLLGDASFNFGGRKTEHREDLHERMIGIARFSEYIRNIYNIAEQAIKTMNDLEKAEANRYNDSLNDSYNTLNDDDDC